VSDWLVQIEYMNDSSFDCRDSLRHVARTLAKRGSAIARTRLENNRRKLEAKIKSFHRRGDMIMEVEDIGDLAPIDGQEEDWVCVEELSDEDRSCGEDEDHEEESESSSDDGGIGQGVDFDGDEDTEFPERTSLRLPSSLGRQQIEDHGLQMLALQEIQLRVGKANDALAALRTELGHKALLFRTKIRHTKNTKGKTRSWKEVKQSAKEVAKHVRCYSRARMALQRLGADDEILVKYQEIKKEDLRMSGDILEENRVGQRSDTLAWFWRLGPNSDIEGNAWMEEGE
jgi:hypothetical protein